MAQVTTHEHEVGLYIDTNLGLLCRTSKGVAKSVQKTCSRMGLFYINKGQHIYLKIQQGNRAIYVEETNFGALLLSSL